MPLGPFNNSPGQVTAGRYPLLARAPGRSGEGSARPPVPFPSRARPPRLKRGRGGSARTGGARARVIGRPPRSRDARTPRAISSAKLPMREGGGTGARAAPT